MGSAILPVISSLKLKLSEVTEVNESAGLDTNGRQIQNMYKLIIEVQDQRYQNNTMLITCTSLDPMFKIEHIMYDDLSVLKESINEFCETTYKSSEDDCYANNSQNHQA